MAVLFAVAFGGSLSVSSMVVADDHRAPGPDEASDTATPQAAPPDDRPPALSPTWTRNGELNVYAAAATRTYIDDFRYDEQVLVGYARDVCVGALLPGAGWAYHELVGRFGGTPGTMYSCRERWDTANNPDCNGQVSNPGTGFYSTCWSNHARGRAIDVMVGTTGGVYNQARGINIVDWLLATDSSGNANSNARRLGIQQILFHDRCWNSDGDRGIGSWSAMRQCGIAHYDHVHIDLTVAGAGGEVSYWGAAPRVDAKLDMLAFWEQNSSWREEVSWLNTIPRSEGGLYLEPKYDDIVVGDFNRDGVADQTFLWDRDSGDWALQDWNNGDSTTVRRGTWSRSYGDQLHVADLDGDGFLNDLFLWNRTTGSFWMVSWAGPAFSTWDRGKGYLHPNWDHIYPADLDGDGRVNEFLVHDVDSGKWIAYTWSNWRATPRETGFFDAAYDRIIVGDWSAGGDLDESLIWDVDAGRWILYTWSNFRPYRFGAGIWGANVDLAVPGDYDTDGRIDELFLYDWDSGAWVIYSWHRNIPSITARQTWGRGIDVISSGAFMY